MYACSASAGGRGGGGEPRSHVPPRLAAAPAPAPAAKAAADGFAFPVYLVVPERELRIATARDLVALGYEARPFAGVEDLAAALPELAPGCVVLDIADLEALPQALREPGTEAQLRFPTIFLFSALDTDGAIAAMRLGAADLVRRPAAMPELVAALRRAAPRVRDLRRRIAEAEARELTDTLSIRERQVMECMMLGFSNKEIGRALGVSHRTVEMHRRRLHRRLGAASLAELLALAWHARRDEGEWG
ncbi:MAG: two-component system, LuxR family, response regulator FixJ [Sphingomonadales bacterium]|jgi:FixJ family two-component response regulator|nr:two-component system, LuxR family, response regulator FixJ [Sphingomonadales bacterium]